MRNATLDSMRPSVDGLRDITREQSGLMRQVTRTTTVCTKGPAPRDGQMALPAGLSYATVDAMANQLPECRYALRKANGDVSFFEVFSTRKGNMIRLLSGAPGAYRQHTMRLQTQYMALRHLLDDPEGAARLYGQESSECGVCHSPLTNAKSRADGIGPHCKTKGLF